MDSITQHQPPFADALRSLALTSSPSPIPVPGKTYRQWCLAALALSGCAVGAFVVAGQFSGPDLALRTDPTPSLAVSAETPAEIAAPLSGSREITGSGYVVAPEQVLVFTQQPGQITQVLVQPGDRVVPGQALIVLSDVNAGFSLEEAQATHRGAELTRTARRIELDRAKAAYARDMALAAGQAVSQQQLEEARATRDLAANAVLQAEQALVAADLAIRIAMERLDELTIRSQIPGIVTRLNARVGDRVLAQLDDPGPDRSLATITDTAGLVIDADVAETSISHLREGLTGEAVLDAWPDHPFAVEILRIAPIITPEKGTVILRLRLIDPPSGILPAMAARIRITTDTRGSDQ